MQFYCLCKSKLVLGKYNQFELKHAATYNATLLQLLKLGL